MLKESEIFEKHYKDYCDQISGVDLVSAGNTLGFLSHDDKATVRFLNRDYRVSGKGVTDDSGRRPPYGVCVILAKYILLCPDRVVCDTEWASIKDFKKNAQFTNVNFFTSDTVQVILDRFSGRPDALFRAGETLGGILNDAVPSYDLAMEFKALPRVSLLLLFNDSDDEFPAQCSVLFQKQAEHYLDPESLVMTGAALAKRLVNADKNT